MHLGYRDALFCRSRGSNREVEDREYANMDKTLVKI